MDSHMDENDMLCSKFVQIGGCKIQLVSIESRTDNRNKTVHPTQGKSPYLSYLMRHYVDIFMPLSFYPSKNHLLFTLFTNYTTI